MKFAHIADLHIGKRVNDFSMLEEQRYIFKEIIEIIRHEDADAVLVAGDIYDKSKHIVLLRLQRICVMIFFILYPGWIRIFL